MHPIAYPSPRVSQLDSHMLDSELHSLLSTQFSTVFAHLGLSRWLIQLNPRLYGLLLRVLVFRYTVWTSGTSYGLGLQNLRLADKSTGHAVGSGKKIALLAALVSTSAWPFVYSYLSSKEDSLRLANHSRLKRWIIEKLYHALDGADKIAKLLELANFISFLVNGKYATLLNRLLGITLNPIAIDAVRSNSESVSYEFQNRQLAWTVMTELAIFTLPLLKFRKLWGVARNVKNQITMSSGTKLTNEHSTSPYADLPVLQCAYCLDYQRRSGEHASATKLITNPMITSCGHVFCYVCIARLLNGASDDAAQCIRCNHTISWFEEYCPSEAIPPKAIVFGIAEEAEEENDHEKGDLLSDTHTEKDKVAPIHESDSYDDAANRSGGEDYSEDEDFQEDDFEVD